jgi:hypothetical protein
LAVCDENGRFPNGESILSRCEEARQSGTVPPSWICYFKGLMSESNRQEQQAIESYELATSLDPSFAAPYFRKGCICWGKKDYRAAREQFELAVQYEPGNGSYQSSVLRARLVVWTEQWHVPVLFAVLPILGGLVFVLIGADVPVPTDWRPYVWGVSVGFLWVLAGAALTIAIGELLRALLQRKSLIDFTGLNLQQAILVAVGGPGLGGVASGIGSVVGDLVAGWTRGGLGGAALGAFLGALIGGIGLLVCVSASAASAKYPPSQSMPNDEVLCFLAFGAVFGSLGATVWGSGFHPAGWGVAGLLFGALLAGILCLYTSEGQH